MHDSLKQGCFYVLITDINVDDYNYYLTGLDLNGNITLRVLFHRALNCGI